MDKLKKLFDPTMFRFLLVGVANTLVGCGVMFELYNLAGGIRAIGYPPPPTTWRAAWSASF